LKEAQSTKRGFYFSGGKDKSRHLSTALGTLALLNLGEDSARKIGQLKNYQVILQGSVDFLLDEARYRSCNFKSTQDRFFIKSRMRFIPHWEDGLFFGPSHWDLCHWRAQSVTHAYVLQALNEYLLAYDKGANLFGNGIIGNNDGNHNGNKLCQLSIRSYDFNELQSGEWLKIEN